MAKNNLPILNFVTPKGIAIWPALQKADTKFNAAGVWNTRLSFDPDDVADLREKLETFLSQCVEDMKANDKKLAKYKTVDIFHNEEDEEGEDTGRVVLNFKRPCVKADGTPLSPPLIVDSKKQKVTATIAPIWGGSVLKISAYAFPYSMPSTKTIGLSLRLKAAQVIDLVTGEGGADAFDEEDGYCEESAESSEDDAEDF